MKYTFIEMRNDLLKFRDIIKWWSQSDDVKIVTSDFVPGTSEFSGITKFEPFAFKNFVVICFQQK